jgi:aminoglycoside phosphotransferase (APT) family kinase protein
MMLQAKLEPHAVLETLGIKGDVKLERAAFGADTAVWKVEHEGHVYGLRVFRPNEESRREREILAMAAAASAGIPVPEVIAQSTWQDRPALLLSWLPGKMMVFELTTKSSPERVQRLSESLGRTLAAIHRVPAPLELRGEPHAWVKLAGPDELELQERLLSLPLRIDALLHMDFHPLNVTLEADHITGVLDWSGATAGDPRADVARFVTLTTLAPISPQPGAPPRTPEEDSLRQRIIAAFEKGYRETGELKDNLALFYAWAGAAIIHNVRSKIGQPGETVQDHHLDGVRRWTDEWKHKAGLLRTG